MMRIYAFLAAMWGLIILGGGVAVMVLGPLDFGPDDQQRTLASAVKAVVAVLLVVLWVFILVPPEKVRLQEGLRLQGLPRAVILGGRPSIPRMASSSADLSRRSSGSMTGIPSSIR